MERKPIWFNILERRANNRIFRFLNGVEMEQSLPIPVERAEGY